MPPVARHRIARACWPALLLATACTGVYYEGHARDDAKRRPAAWAAVVDDQAARQLVVQRLEAVAGGALDCAAYARPLVIGPALWGDVARAEPGLAKVGWHGVALVQTSASLGYLEWDMRTLRSTADVCAFLQSPRLRLFARELSARGRVRPANEGEREFFYRISPLNLTGHSLIVIEHPQETFIAYVEERQILWLEVLTGWRQGDELWVMTQPGQVPGPSVNLRNAFPALSPDWTPAPSIGRTR